MGEELQLALLGNLEIHRDGAPVAALRSGKAQALLCYLAVTDRPHLRPALVGLLWGDMPEANARNNLNKALTHLRQAVGRHLCITRQAVAFDRESPYWLDVEIFETEASGVFSVGPSAEVAPSRSDAASARIDIERLQSVVELYRGHFLEGFHVRQALAFEEWVLAQRARLRELALGALHTLAVHHTRRGAAGHAAGIDYTSRLLALEPWREAAHRQLMLLLARSGKRGAALAQYDACRQVLGRELGVEPGAETTALYEQIRDGALTKRTESAQVGVGEQSDSRHGAPGLPAPLTRLIGREQELDEIRQLLRDLACRLLTLVGPGGSGKTRLALEAGAAQLADFEDGVFLVSLAPLRSVESIEPTVATALGLSLYLPGDPRQQLLGYLREKNLLLILDNFEHLLLSSLPPEPVLGPDGTSAVERAGERGGESLVTDILQAAPDVQVLVTSRVGMKVRGEHLYPVTGMGAPSVPSMSAITLADVAQYDAVKLFVAAARQAQPAFDLTDDNLTDVVRICHLVGGMPLGILMAAAWVEVLTTGDIAVEVSESLDFLEIDLSDVPERQRSMRAVLDHSWNLLSERQRELLLALSVFRGGFTRQAAQRVAGASLRDLKLLVGRSLLERTPDPSPPLETGPSTVLRTRARYEMHELLRQYAADKLHRADKLRHGEKLEGSPDAGETAGDRHCAYYVGALERWELGLKGDRQEALLAAMRLDIENTRAAWDWAAARAQVDRLGRAVEGLCYYYYTTARFRECEAACRAAAKRLEAEVCVDGSVPGKAEGLRVLARILGWRSQSTLHLFNFDLSTQLALQGLALLEHPELVGLDTRRERTRILQWGALAMVRSEPERSRRLWQEGLSLSRAMGDQRGTAEALYHAGTASLSYGDPEEAEALLRESVAICQRSGYPALGAKGLWRQATAFHLSGQFDRSRSLLEDRLANYDDLGDVLGSAHRYRLLGLVHLELGHYQQARAYGQLGLALSRQIDFRLVIGWSLALLARAALAEANRPPGGAIPPGTAEDGEVHRQYADALRMAQESVAVSRELWQQCVANALSVLGLAARGLGKLDKAQQHLFESLQISSEIGVFQWYVLPLSAIAILLADLDERVQAVELYALACRYPLVANSRWFELVFGRHIAAVAATLPPEVAEAARERGRARDLEATIQELLVELNAWDSQHPEPSQP